MIKKQQFVVVFVFAVDYHRGQWSRLYRLQCRLRKYLKVNKKNSWQYNYMTKCCRATKLYKELVDKFGDE